MRLFQLSSIDEICAEIGERLKTLRLAQNMTQAQLAKRVGLSLPSIVRMERHGRVTFEQIVKVAHVLSALDTLEALFVPTQPIFLDEQIKRMKSQRQRARPKVNQHLSAM